MTSNTRHSRTRWTECCRADSVICRKAAMWLWSGLWILRTGNILSYMSCKKCCIQTFQTDFNYSHIFVVLAANQVVWRNDILSPCTHSCVVWRWVILCLSSGVSRQLSNLICKGQNVYHSSWTFLPFKVIHCFFL